MEKSLDPPAPVAAIPTGRRLPARRIGLALGLGAILAAGLGTAGLILGEIGHAAAAGALFALLGLGGLVVILRAATAPARTGTAAEAIGQAAMGLSLGVSVYDPEDRLRHADPLVRHLMGRPPGEDMIGRTFAEIAWEDARQGRIASAAGREGAWIAERLAAHRDPKQPVEVETAAGRWVRIVERRTPDGWTVSIGTEITELKARERDAAARMAARSRLEAALDALDSNVMLFDADGRLVLAGRAARDAYAPLGDMFAPGMAFSDWLSVLPAAGLAQEVGRDLPAWRRAMEQAFAAADGRRLRRELNGRSLDFHAHRAEDGSIIVVESNLSAVLEREQALTAHGALLRATLDNTHQGIAAFDSDLRLLSWNRQLALLFNLPDRLLREGTPLADIHDWLFQTCLPPDMDSEAFARERERAFRAATGERHAMRLADDREVEMRVHDAGEGRVVATYADLTQERRRAAQLQAAKEVAELAHRGQSRFLANITHELRTPLNAIIGFAEVLRDELFGPLGNRQYKDFVVDIHDSGTHLLALINDILDYTKTESGQRALAEAPFQLSSAINAATRMIAPKVEERGVTLTVEAPDDDPLIQGEERAIRQVLINLLSNAVKFTPKGGTIRVEAGRLADGGVEIVVADTGIGMEEKDIPRALAPFVQVDSELSREFEGTGLGLPLAKNLVALHDGTLRLESRPGEGTRVRIALPRDRVAREGEK